MAPLHPRVPDLGDGRHPRVPLGHHRGAAPHHQHDDPRVGGRHGPDQGHVLVGQAERAAVAAHREPRAAGHHVGRGLDAGAVRDLGGEGRGRVGVVGRGQEVVQLGGAADELALVGVGAADHGDHEVGVGELGDDVDAEAGHGPDPGLGQGGAQALEHRHRVGGPHVARAAVAQVHGVGQAAHHDDGAQGVGVQRQQRRPLDGLVAEQDDRPLGRLPGQGPVRGAGQHGPVGRGAVEDLGEAQPGGDHVGHGPVDVVPRDLAGVEGGAQVVGPLHPVRHLDVEPGPQRGAGVAQAVDEVADREPVEAPPLAQHLGEQHPALAAPLAVDRVVGAHHAGHALVDDPAEVGQVDVVQGLVVDGDVDPEPGLLHRVAGEVLHARHGVALDAPGEGGAHLADVVRVLAVGLLGPAPPRVAEHVDAHPAVQVGADRPQLAADGLADALLEVRVPRGAPGHRHREARRPVDHHAPGAVGEPDAREAQPLDPGRRERRAVVAAARQVGDAGPERPVAVEAAQPLVLGHGRDQRGGLRACCLGVHERRRLGPAAPVDGGSRPIGCAQPVAARIMHCSSS